MTTKLEERFPYAVLADIHPDTAWVRWNGGVWHTPSRWRGLRPGEGIPDTDRVARTLCGEMIPIPFDQEETGINTGYCAGCEREYERIEAVKRGRGTGGG